MRGAFALVALLAALAVHSTSLALKLDSKLAMPITGGATIALDDGSFCKFKNKTGVSQRLDVTPQRRKHLVLTRRTNVLQC